MKRQDLSATAIAQAIGVTRNATALACVGLACGVQPRLSPHAAPALPPLHVPSPKGRGPSAGLNAHSLRPILTHGYEH
jgi:hypothetical protein